jgi:cell division transport system permease protein
MTLFLRALAKGLRQTGQNPRLYLMTAAALGLTCFLSGAFGLFLYNLDRHLHEHQGSAQVQVYWKPGMDMGQVREQWRAIKAMPGVRDLRVFTPDEALEGLKKSLGQDQDQGKESLDLSWLGGTNPMPATALIDCAVPNQELGPWTDLLEQLKSLPGVAKVRLSPMQLDVAQALRSLSAKAFWPLSGSLCLVIALVAYFSARLCLEGLRAEVEIMRLVGATEWFVRLPFAVSGAVTAMAGAAAGLGGLELLRWFLAQALYQPPLWIVLHALPWPQTAAMAFAALLMAAFGGWLAAGE